MVVQFQQEASLNQGSLSEIERRGQIYVSAKPLARNIETRHAMLCYAMLHHRTCN